MIPEYFRWSYIFQICLQHRHILAMGWRVRKNKKFRINVLSGEKPWTEKVGLIWSLSLSKKLQDTHSNSLIIIFCMRSILVIFYLWKWIWLYTEKINLSRLLQKTAFGCDYPLNISEFTFQGQLYRTTSASFMHVAYPFVIPHVDLNCLTYKVQGNPLVFAWISSISTNTSTNKNMLYSNWTCAMYF